MFPEDDNGLPWAPCYDRQAKLPNLPPNARDPQTIQNTRSLVSRLSAPNACPVEAFPTGPVPKDQKKLYRYKTMLLQELVNDRSQLCGQCCTKCHARIAALPLFLLILLLADPRLSRRGKKLRHQQVRTLQGNNWDYALEADVAQPDENCERRWPASPQHMEGGGAMQVVRDAILKPPYKRRSMYVLVMTIVKQIADRCNFCDSSKSLVLKIQK